MSQHTRPRETANSVQALVRPIAAHGTEGPPTSREATVVPDGGLASSVRGSSLLGDGDGGGGGRGESGGGEGWAKNADKDAGVPSVPGLALGLVAAAGAAAGTTVAAAAAAPASSGRAKVTEREGREKKQNGAQKGWHICIYTRMCILIFFTVRRRRLEAKTRLCAGIRRGGKGFRVGPGSTFPLNSTSQVSKPALAALAAPPLVHTVAAVGRK